MWHARVKTVLSRIVHSVPSSRTLAGLALLFSCYAPLAFAQGQFGFVNYDRGGLLRDEPVSVFDPATGTCIRPLGDDWHADLLAGVPAKGLSLSALSPALDFNPRFGPGYLPGALFTVQGGHSQDIAEVFVRAFQGSSFDTASVRGVAGPFTVRLVEAPGGPEVLYLPPGSLNMCIPEPRTITLIAAGVIILWVARRRIGRSRRSGVYVARHA